MKSQAFLNSPGSTSSLLSVATSDIGFPEAGDLPFLIESHLFFFARINDAGDVCNKSKVSRIPSNDSKTSLTRNSHTSLGDIRADDDFADTSWHGLKYRRLSLRGDARVQGKDAEIGGHSKAFVIVQQVAARMRSRSASDAAHSWGTF